MKTGNSVFYHRTLRKTTVLSLDCKFLRTVKKLLYIFDMAQLYSIYMYQYLILSQAKDMFSFYCHRFSRLHL